MYQNKAQVSQAFTYIVIILVIGVIAVFGYKGISSILSANCEHQRVSFENNLLGFIEEYTDKGSVHQEVMEAPCEIIEVCFADSDYCEAEPRPGLNNLPEEDKVIYSNVDSCTANIFFIGEFTEAVAYSDDVSLSNTLSSTGGADNDYPFKCFSAKSGEFNFLFKGTGRRTMIISGWEQELSE